MREVGLPAILAVAAHAAGDFGRAVDLLRPLRNRSHRFGGSRAQRDVIDLTRIRAAREAGREALARALETEREMPAARRGSGARAPAGTTSRPALRRCDTAASGATSAGRHGAPAGRATLRLRLRLRWRWRWRWRWRMTPRLHRPTIIPAGDGVAPAPGVP